MSKQLDKKILGYTAAAVAAGLVGAHQSGAAIIVDANTGSPSGSGSPTPSTGQTATFSVDIDGDGTNDVQIQIKNNNGGADLYYIGNSPSMGTSAPPSALGSSGKLGWGQTGGADDTSAAFVKNFIGTTIDGTSLYDNKGNNDDHISGTGQFTTDGSTVGYIGVHFLHNNNSATPVYGWVGIKMTPVDNSGTNAETATITGYAYEDSGAGILAGATSSVPEPVTLSALALGALGLLRRRPVRI